jgi:Flp pilus assembly pilin Flp
MILSSCKAIGKERGLTMNAPSTKKIKSLETGQAMIEYGLILVFVSIVVIVILSVLGKATKKPYEDILLALNVPTPGSNDPIEYCKGDMNSMDDWLLQGNKTKDWQTNDGKLCMNNKGGSNYAYSKCSANSMPNQSDYVVRLSGANLLGGSGYGVMLCEQNNDGKPSGYSFQYDPGKGYFVFKKWVDGVEKDLEKARPPAHPNYDWHNVERDVVVEMKGDTMSAYVDGELVLVATDDTYSSGSVGIRTWYSSDVCFNDFSIGSAP